MNSRTETIGPAAVALGMAIALAAAPLAAGAEPQPAGGTEPSSSQPPQASQAGDDQDHADRWWAIQLQGTDVFQYKPSMRSPYEGTNSLPGAVERANTLDASLIVGLRPWKGAQFWFDEDMNQGFAPGNTLGAAGFVNGEGAKVGHASPYYRLQRYLYRQTIELGGGDEDVDRDMLEFGGKTTKNRIVVTVGKFSLTDVMDDNAYAHDPKNDVLNWALIDTGSWDYAADAWGFSEGGIVEWYEGDWTFRGGAMKMSTIPNSGELAPHFGEFQWDAEVELGRYDDALALATGALPDTAQVRHFRSRPGVALNIEEPVSDDAGLFVRAGWSNGDYESYEYTDIDRTFAAGASISGAKWGRKDDTVAVAVVVNGISKVHEAFLNAGGLGILVGDGQLPHPGPESILEAYYSLGVIKGVHLTLDSQTVVNPAYNRDRGPAEVIGLRIHGQFQ
jgi:high affinity Mn2+ porin